MKIIILAVVAFLLITVSCNDQQKESKVAGIELKKGPVISCGPADKEFGSLNFAVGCDGVKDEFNFGVKLLHSFEYDEAEKAFAAVVDKDPNCAMAYWGVAMANFHSLWAPPTQDELVKGSKSIEIARSLKPGDKELDYINALGSFYNNWENLDHKTRCITYEKEMERIAEKYPDDKEASIFYALAMVTAADPADKTYAKQRKAGKILENLYPGQTDHPGIVHYIIHAYDSPELAEFGLDAARKYASIAPSSAHALHMPSHIFTRLGLWDECIRSNQASVSSAMCYAQAIGLKGHWDEELHGLDYLAYAYLQQGNNDSAKKVLDYLNTIKLVEPLNFKVSYAYAAIPSRIVLENKRWKEAANLEAGPAGFPWKDHPWQYSIVHFTRLMGAVHTNDLPAARKELETLQANKTTLLGLKDTYKANQVDIQAKTGEAWILLKEGRKDEALTLMQQAAKMEDETGKHPVTPGEVLPARELLGEMLLELGKPDLAFAEFESSLHNHKNRLNGLRGVLKAARLSGKKDKEKQYQQVLDATLVISSR